MRSEELAGKFFQTWQHSPAHHKNMLDPAVTDIGVGVVQNSDGGYFFAVQMFEETWRIRATSNVA